MEENVIRPYPENGNFSINVAELWKDSNGYPMIEEKKRGGKREEVHQ